MFPGVKPIPKDFKIWWYHYFLTNLFWVKDCDIEAFIHTFVNFCFSYTWLENEILFFLLFAYFYCIICHLGGPLICNKFFEKIDIGLTFWTILNHWFDILSLKVPCDIWHLFYLTF